MNDVPEEKSVKQLREEAIELGLAREDSLLFITKKPLIATINSLKAARVDKDEEVKRVKTLNPSPDPKEEKQVERQWRSKAERMRAKLDAQPKETFFIPLSGEEKSGVVREIMVKGRKEFVHVSGAIETVTLNGYKTIVPKGVRWKVPEQVADVLSKSYEDTQNAGKEYLVDRIDNKTGKQVKDQLG